VTKWGGGATKELSSASSTLYSYLPTFFHVQCPLPRLRVGPESLPGLRNGYSDTSPSLQVPTTNKETPRSPASPLTVPETRLHQPAASRPSEDWARRGRPNLSPEIRDPPPQRCPRTGIGPFPPCRRLLGLTARASSCFLCAHPPAGAQRRPLKPYPSAGTAASTAETEANPLFLF